MLKCFQLYMLAGYDGTQRYNIGQVGLGQLDLFLDDQLTQSAC